MARGPPSKQGSTRMLLPPACVQRGSPVCALAHAASWEGTIVGCRERCRRALPTRKAGAVVFQRTDSRTLSDDRVTRQAQARSSPHRLDGPRLYKGRPTSRGRTERPHDRSRIFGSRFDPLRARAGLRMPSPMAGFAGERFALELAATPAAKASAAKTARTAAVRQPVGEALRCNLGTGRCRLVRWTAGNEVRCEWRRPPTTDQFIRRCVRWQTVAARHCAQTGPAPSEMAWPLLKTI